MLKIISQRNIDWAMHIIDHHNFISTNLTNNWNSFSSYFCNNSKRLCGIKVKTLLFFSCIHYWYHCSVYSSSKSYWRLSSGISSNRFNFCKRNYLYSFFWNWLSKFRWLSVADQSSTGTGILAFKLVYTWIMSASLISLVQKWAIHCSHAMCSGWLSFVDGAADLFLLLSFLNVTAHEPIKLPFVQ